MEREEKNRRRRKEVDPDVLDNSVDMWREQEALAKFGPISIIFESFRLFYTHTRVFFQIQFALVYPIVIFNIGLLTIFTHYVAKTHPSSPVATNFSLQQLLDNTRAPDGSLSPIWRILCTGLVSELLMVACKFLWIGAVYYSVGLIYTGKTISFLDVVYRIPILWKRLMITWLWLVRFMVGIFLLCFGFNMLMANLVSESEIPSYWILLTAMEALIYWIYLIIVFGVAGGVSVMEEGYGLAAIKKSKQLLKGGRIWAAVGVIAIIFSFSFHLLVLASLTENLRKISLDSGEGFWEKLVLLLWVVLNTLWKSLLSQFVVMSRAVTYASFKAYHGESIADSGFFMELTKDGYQSLGVLDGSVESDPKAGFQKLVTDESEEIDTKDDQLINSGAMQHPDNLV